MTIDPGYRGTNHMPTMHSESTVRSRRVTLSCPPMSGDPAQSPTSNSAEKKVPGDAWSPHLTNARPTQCATIPVSAIELNKDISPLLGRTNSPTHHSQRYSHQSPDKCLQPSYGTPPSPRSDSRGMNSHRDDGPDWLHGAAVRVWLAVE